jgi:Leucine-rich repeat (LRR) protein
MAESDEAARGFQIAMELIVREKREQTGKLDLADLALTEVPAWVGHLRHLRELRLGRLPWADAPKGRPVLSANTLSDLAPLAGLAQLQALNCSFTHVADLAPLAGLHQLQTLDCWDTKVADLAPLAGLTHLQTLNCWNTQVTDLAPLAGLGQLRTLNCWNTQVADLAPLAGLHQLQTLNCWDTKVADLAPLAGLAQLQTLNCWNTQVADLAPLAGLAQLQSLDCSHTQVADLAPLTGLDQLQTLNCWETLVADLAPLAGLAQLQSLACSYTQVADLAPLAGLDQLQSLDCSGTQVADLAPLADLVQLQSLDCSDTQVADLGPLAGLSRLRTLKARNTRVRRLPRWRGALQSLEAGAEIAGDGLDLRENDLEDPLPRLIAPGNPQATRNVLAWLRGELDPADVPLPETDREAATDDEPPPLPAPGAGLRVLLDPVGRLTLAKPGDLDAEGNDRKRLEALHPTLREAAVELADALRGHASNLANERLLRRAEAYRALVDVPLPEVDFARLYAVGAQLRNAEAATRVALAAGRADVPDLTPAQDECLRTLTELHPGFVLASKAGTEMLADQTLIELTASDVQALSEAGQAMGEALLAQPDLADPAIGEAIRDAAAEIGQGQNEQRDAATSVSMLRNVVVVLGTGATAAALPVIAGIAAGTAASVAGGAAAWFLLKAIEKTRAFVAVQNVVSERVNRVTEADLLLVVRRIRGQHKLFVSQEGRLRRITNLPAFRWLGDTLDWIKRQPPPDRRGPG